ncbi:hypothetical protein CEXT_218061 [Caerostris extrusa]|uniref:Uncharacterized protein n=1 Tax=Caerostris extrusa TaxID=172846 RepID=A0AAV4MDM1_CAEEX|nr:hypothetical protein CEXT_218061 [Caerostris extrusa]
MKSDTFPPPQYAFCTLLYRMRGPMNRLLIGQDTVEDKRISTLKEMDICCVVVFRCSIMGGTGYTHYASSRPSPCHKHCPCGSVSIGLN